MSAVISECGKYRYVLQRSLGSFMRWHRPILFIMLNPSTADAAVNDPTIRRCMSLAVRDGFTHLTVVNLFAYRATDPKDLLKAVDPVGPDNDHHILDQVQKHSNAPIIAAWGAHKIADSRSLWIAQRVGLRCYGKTKDGYPRHPLYLKSDAEIIDL